MKKTISGVLLALASVCALAACGKKTTTAKTTTAKGGTTPTTTTAKEADIKANGVEIEFYCWNNEFQERLRAVYPNYGKKISAKSDILKDGTIITWTMVSNEGGAYQSALMNGLVKDIGIDMYLFEADYATKFVKSEFAASMKDVGVLEDMADQYDYTKQFCTNDANEVVASSWQATPGAIAYNTKVVEKCGITDVETKLNDATKFAALAAEVKAAGKNCYTLIGPDDWYRTYGYSVTEKQVDAAGKITVNEKVMQWVVDTMEFQTKGYIKGVADSYGLWQSDWATSQGSDDVLTVFTCPWYNDFCLTGNCVVEEGESSPYKVVKGYSGWFWGGSFLTANPDSLDDAGKAAAIKDIIKQMTTNKDVLKNISLKYNDFCNTVTGMKELAEDKTVGVTYFGGQNIFAVFYESCKLADMSKACDYDQYINEQIQSAFRKYFQGTATPTQCWDKFVAGVKESTGEEDLVIEVSSKVSITDAGITIA